MSKLHQKRRDKMGIISEILKIAQKEVLKTKIMYRANLSFAQLNDYLSSMINSGLLAKVIKKKSFVYLSTQKGHNFLRKFREITCLLDSENENSQLYLKSLVLRKNTFHN